jgi:acetate kinase
MDAILVINAGSSSVKFQVFGVDRDASLARLIKGQMDGVGAKPQVRAEANDRTVLINKQYTRDKVPDVAAAIAETGSWLSQNQQFNLVAIGHRVVHGGPGYDRPVLVDRSVLAVLETYVSLAPLHQPNNLAPIRSLLTRFPDLPQVACFDTAFHRSHSALADHFAIPEQFYQDGIRRYGFHGLSYEYVSDQLRQVAVEVAARRVIVAHLGSGASLCALFNSRSVESTMAFTALDGLPMGTRPGQIDPGVVLHLISEKNMTATEVEDLFYRHSGLKGLSGISNDVRVLLDSKDPRAAFAIDYFVYRVALHTGMLAAALGGLDAFVFTAGIGENSAEMRARISSKLGWLGAVLDPSANNAGKTLISEQGSLVKLFLIPTDEELMIARHTLAVLSARASIRKMPEVVSSRDGLASTLAPVAADAPWPTESGLDENLKRLR